MDFYISVKHIGNGYIIEYPTGEKKELDAASMFFGRSSEERCQWYCATKKQLEEVMPKLTMEVLARVEADSKVKAD